MRLSCCLLLLAVLSIAPRDTTGFFGLFGGSRQQAPKTVVDRPTIEQPTQFWTWCDEVGIRAPCLEHGITTDGIPGIKVRPYSQLKPGETAIILPIKACIVVHDGDGSSPIPDILDDKSWSTASSKLRLACILLDERRKGTLSYYQGYVDHLPAQYPEPGWERADTLDQWTNAELDLLKSPELQIRTEQRVREDTEWYSRLSTTTPDEECVFSHEDFTWALSIVRTRAFAGDFTAGPERTAARRRSGGDDDATKPQDYALLPLIDDLNHRETTGERKRFDINNSRSAFQFAHVGDVLGRTKTNVCWVAHIAHVGGEEVAHSYLHGPEGIGEDFLHEWGFTPAAQDIDATTLDVMGVQIVIRGDGNISDELRVMDKIRAELVPSLSSNVEAASDSDVWECISKACDTADAYLTNDEDDDINGRTSSRAVVAPHRKAIAQAFIEGKSKLLKSCSKRCRESIVGSSRYL